MAGSGRAPGRQERADGDRGAARAAGPPIPGVVIVWSGEAPALQALRLPSLGVILGRELLGPRATDDRISRQHARVRWNGTAFAIADLGSRNGTYVGGALVSESELTVTAPCVLRTGRTVSVLVGDVRIYEGGEVAAGRDGAVGPLRAAAHDAVRRAARGPAAVASLLVVGEPGAGVDAAVSVFHDAAGGGPLVEIEAGDAAAAKWRPGAGGAPPAAAGAHGGTLVIHDVGALDAAGQDAVAAILGAGELPAGGGAAPVDARVVATCDPDDLDGVRAAVAAGTFRDDLWRRLQHRIDVPPLRACCEELPHWVVARLHEVAPDLTVHSTLIEACLLRPWPGNVDELRHEIAAAAGRARSAGKHSVRAEHLDPDAGQLLAGAHDPAAAPSPVETARLRRSRIRHPLELGAVRAALDAAAGDLSRAAIALGVHRNRLRRFVADHPELAPLVTDDDLHRTAVITHDD